MTTRDIKFLQQSRRDFLTSSVKLAGLAGAFGLVQPHASALAAEPEKPSELFVRAWGGAWSDALKQKVSDEFSKLTGITVTHDNTYHAEMKTKIWEAQAQNRTPPVHINWDVSDIAYESAVHGACVDLADLPVIADMKAAAVPVGVTGVPYLNPYLYVYALIYRPSKFPDGAPKSWKVLLDPQFKGRIVATSSGNGIIHAAQVAAGGKVSDMPDNMQAGWDFIAEFRKQNPLLGKDEDMTKWWEQNEADVALNIISNVTDIRDKGGDVAWTVPEEGAYATNDCLWVPKGFPQNEEYWAKQYVNFAMTKDPNQNWCDALALPGLNKGFVAPAKFKDDPAYPTTDEQLKKVFFIPSEIQVKHWDEWVLKYKSIMNI